MKKQDVKKSLTDICALVDRKEPGAAMALARYVLKNSPAATKPYLQLASIAEGQERFDHALMWLDMGIEKNGDDVALLAQKAFVLLDGFEDLGEAFVTLLAVRKALGQRSLAELKGQIDPLILIEVFLLLADCFRLMDNYNLAKTYAEMAMKIDPENAAAILAFATARFELGEYDAALQLIDLHAEKAPADFFWLRAQILCALGRFDEADDYFIRAHDAERNRYHRIIRLTDDEFSKAIEQALSSLPGEIQDLARSIGIRVKDVVPVESVRESEGFFSPIAAAHAGAGTELMTIFKKNIENMATKKEAVRDIIASALLHELIKVRT